MESMGDYEFGDMRLSNRFDEADKIRVWGNHQYCALCSSNQHCSLHHIDSSREKYHSSIFNAVMLCGKCHLIADANNVTENDLKLKLTEYALRMALPVIDKNDNDRKYLESIKDRLNKIAYNSRYED
jgi:5-methylcytosine-specific restriction endonuclease McrA